MVVATVPVHTHGPYSHPTEPRSNTRFAVFLRMAEHA
jgi:hypothetical protein